MSAETQGAPTEEDAQARLRALIGGYRVSQALYVATWLGIPDLLADGPREIDELARATQSHAPSLRRVMFALVAAGLFDKVGPNRIALTPVATALRADVPGSRRASVLFLLSESHWRPWGHLLHTVRTGENSFAHAHGANLFDYLADHPEEARLFNAGMAGNSPAHARLIAASYDFSRMKCVVDVAGGRGRLLATILQENAGLRGILFDLPHVIDDARQLIGEAGVADRCAFVGGDFFAEVPRGGGAYVLRNIIHDWDDDQAIVILSNCRRAMGEGALLILVERYVPDDPREAPGIFINADLEMLVNVGGQERTTEQYAALLSRSGLRLVRTIPLGAEDAAMGHYLIEAGMGLARQPWSHLTLR